MTTFAYDTLNRITTITDALGGQTAFTHDPNGNLLTVKDARGNTLTHTYGAMDRLATRTDPLGAVHSFSYDGNGNLVRTTDRKGQTTTFTYDALNRRTEAAYADGARVTFAYDAAGRLVQATDAQTGPIDMIYDPLDRLVTERTAMGTVAYAYDTLGRRTQMTVNDGSPVSYTYDANSRLRTITQAPLNPVTIDYDSVDRRTKLTLPNAASTEYQYDASSRLTALTYRNATGLLGDLTYTYDAAENRIGTGGSFTRTLLPDPVGAATYDAENHQLTLGDKTLTYDPSGNLTSVADLSGVTTYTWDARNRLTALAGPGLTASFVYDPFGRRLSKTVNGATTQYVYDGPDIAQELQASTPSGYLRLLTLDTPLVRNGEEFYLADGLGSILGLTDAAGALRTRYVYDPFGRTTVEGTPSTNPFQYTGREHDATGLYYYRARYYSPAKQRFLSQDLVLRFGANRYTYVRNSPANGIDPFGLDTLIVQGGLASSGPGGISAGNDPMNRGLQAIIRELQGAREPFAIFNSGQQRELVQKAQDVVGKGRPLFLVGHSLGGQRAVKVAIELFGLGITPDHVFTIDPYLTESVALPPGVPTTNFVQTNEFFHPLRGSRIENATNLEIFDPGYGHFTITGHYVIQNTIIRTIIGSQAAPVGGRY